jgi:hypothetical protein
MDAAYFDSAICMAVKGLVCSRSRVPDLFSSAMLLMVTAGMSIRNTHGAMIKRVSIVAYPPFRIFIGPSKTHINKLLMSRKMMMTI